MTIQVCLADKMLLLFFPVKDWALSVSQVPPHLSVCVCVYVIYICMCVCECVLKELAFSDLVREKQIGMIFLVILVMICLLHYYHYYFSSAG